MDWIHPKDAAKSIQAENTAGAGGVISIEVRNEFASVTRRKLDLSFVEIQLRE